MADGFNRFNTGGQQYFYQNTHSGHPRNIHHRNGSPISNSRGLFQPNPDTPSPNRSPGTHSPAHNPYGNMYNHNNHRQNHSLLNGGAGHNYQNQMGLHKGFQSQSHGHQNHHLNNQHQDHAGIGGHGNTYGNHQHNISASTLSNTTPHFTPAHLQNGTPDNSTALTKPPNEHWREQLQEYQKLKMAEHKPHFYARTTPHVMRTPGSTLSTMSQRTDVEEHGERRRMQASDEPEEAGEWDAMDLGGHGLKSMGASIFRHYPNLHKIYFNHNKLTWLPIEIGHMRSLTVLDLSFNDLRYLPPEIGMLTNLKRLLLYENQLEDLPHELGFLYQLETLGVEGNPLRPDYKQRIVEDGTRELVRYLREQAERKCMQRKHKSIGILTFMNSTCASARPRMDTTRRSIRNRGRQLLRLQLEHIVRPSCNPSCIRLYTLASSIMGSQKRRRFGRTSCKASGHSCAAGNRHRELQ